MALNPNIVAKTVSLSTNSQLDNIASGGTETVGSDSWTADESAVYLTPDDSLVIADIAPTTSTVGYVGQMRLVTTAGSEALYICTNAGGLYTWKQITLS